MFFLLIHIYLLIPPRTVTEQKYRQREISEAFVAEDWNCWVGEGTEVNYSITG